MRQLERRRTCADWLRATRPWSLSVSLLPPAAFVLSLVWNGVGVDVANAVFSLAVLMFVHLGANILSDCRDAETGVDGAGARNGVTWIADGLFTLRELRAFGIVLLAFGTAFGLVVALRSSWTLLAVGSAGLALAAFYSALKRHALGDLTVLLCFTLLPAAGLGLACANRLALSDLFILLPNGLLTLAVLHANNVRDIESDSEANCRTLASHLAPNAARFVYAFELFAPYALVAALLFARLVPYAAIGTFLTLPEATRVFSVCRTGEWTTLDRETARFQFLFGFLFLLAFPIGMLGFWLQLALGALVLVLISLRLRPPLPKRIRDWALEVPLGLVLAAVLWSVFWIGDAVSRLLFDFARKQVDQVYALGSDASPWILGGLLLLLIGPAEELFWRGTLQRHLAERLGPNFGCAITVLAYTAVHVFSLNFMLVGAAAVCGLFWGLLYRFFPRHFAAILVSHAVWDTAVFVLLPIK